MLNTTNPYPTPETLATAEGRTKEKIRRALELRNSFFAKYRSAGRYALEHGTNQEECNLYFCAYYRADRLWKELQHQL